MELVHRPCDVQSCLFTGVGYGGVELLHRPCDVLSCMSVGLGWVGWGGVGVGWSYYTDHVMCGPVYLQGWGMVGWSYYTDHVTCCPVCLWDWVGLGGLGWGGVTTQTM